MREGTVMSVSGGMVRSIFERASMSDWRGRMRLS
jgi:hypothetical protein